MFSLSGYSSIEIIVKILTTGIMMTLNQMSAESELKFSQKLVFEQDDLMIYDHLYKILCFPLWCSQSICYMSSGDTSATEWASCEKTHLEKHIKGENVEQHFYLLTFKSQNTSSSLHNVTEDKRKRGLNFNKYLQSKWKTQIVSAERRSGSKDLSFNPVRQQEDS